MKLRTILSIGVVQALGILVATARGKLFAVLLGPAGFGIVATIDQLVVSSVQILNLSIPFTALKYLSKADSQNETTFRRSYAAFLKTILILAGAATLLTCSIIPPSLSWFDAQLAPFRSTVFVALLGIPATMLLMFLVNVLAARQEGVRSVSLTVVSAAVILMGGGAGCLLGGIPGIYLGTVAASSLLVLCTLWYFHAKLGLTMSGKFRDIAREFQSSGMLKFAVLMYFAVASGSIQLLVARYVSLSFLSADAAGLLQACLATALSIGAVLGPANALYFVPYVNRDLPSLEKIGAANSFLPRLVFLYCLGATPILLLPGFTLHVLYSKLFAEAASILPWFILWQCLYHISNVYQQLLLGLDDAKGYCAIACSANLLCAGLCFVLAPRFGLTGIAFCFVGSAIHSTLFTILRLRWKHHLRVPAPTLSLIGIAFIGFAGVSVLGTLTPEGTLQGSLARGATAGLFLACVWFALPRNLKDQLWFGFRSQLRSVFRVKTVPNAI